MQAVILAAGAGTRLGSPLGDRPKCLLPLGDRPLLDFQLTMLRRAGIERICVVVGYHAAQVRAAGGARCDYIQNADFATTNSLYSLALCRDWVDGPLIVCNADVLAHPAVYDRLLAVRGNAVAYDSGTGSDPEHTKVAFTANGLLKAISKHLPIKFVEGESLGILKFEAEATMALFRETERVLQGAGSGEWVPAAVDRLARTTPIAGIDVRGLPWAEIDFPEDLDYAMRRVWPAIHRAGETWDVHRAVSAGAGRYAPHAEGEAE